MSGPSYEMWDDPYKMLILLATMVAEESNQAMDYEQIPFYENETFQLQNEAFLYKKDQTEIHWHQFLGRDISCSKDLTRQEFNRMFVDCMASLYANSEPIMD